MEAVTITHEEPTRYFSNVDRNDPKQLIDYIEGIAFTDEIQYVTKTVFNSLNLKAGDKVADLGCGTGKDAVLISHAIGQEGLYMGVDLSEEMVKYAAEKYMPLGNVQFSAASATDSQLESDFYTVAKCERLLQHVPQPSQVIQEMVRVVKNGGQLSIIDTDWDSSQVSNGQDPVIRDITRRIFSAVFNQHKDIGVNLKKILKDNANLTNIKVKPFLLTTESLDFANKMYCLTSRGEVALQHGLINEAEFTQWKAAMDEMDKNGIFYFTLNYFTGNAIVKKD
ncbi:hypothetical protein DFA_09900 [Cavenderia fasciculata]|uniref:Methyltransferase domain-containing protein n=1 Tax=Cavenderia fasciculata TaxID=261658 RepID=F4Q8Q8_CACFS|nr:uncharacterized protein DFA_09900 [Cavenderia fasciculata]EGG15077.1 hypothetical protein DFA_09900 [Cavenderia fasciculata]|eukprot:XP_004351797.1 hypothetical protein DFA_09900 [Cavenderia fasciculata]